MKPSTRQRDDQDVQDDELHLGRPRSSCPGTPGCGPPWSPAMNTARIANIEHPVQTGSHPAGAHLAERVLTGALHRRRGEAVVRPVHRAGRGAGGRGGEQARRRGRTAPPCPRRPAACSAAATWLTFNESSAVAPGLEAHRHTPALAIQSRNMAANTAPALLLVFGQLAEGVGEGERDGQDQDRGRAGWSTRWGC